MGYTYHKNRKDMKYFKLNKQQQESIALGGSSALFPNGVEIVTESRDFQSSDVGKLLVIVVPNILLTTPVGNSVGVNNIGKVIGIYAIADNIKYYNGANSTVNILNVIGAYPSELLTVVIGDNAGQTTLTAVGTSLIEDGGVVKTALRYLYDKVNASDGDGDIFITKTKAEIDALISTNALVKGATYKITGVHPTLYNDGTNSGTTIILKAISENVLETQGTGIFYNPKYNQSIDGFGIWDNKMYGTLSNVVGVFDYLNKELVTADNSATGLMLADGMIQWVSGDWSAALSITGSVSGATADVDDFVTPSYSIGDKVIWGGYSWTNVNGNVGTSTDVLNLDSEWTKDVYDTTNYNLAYDVIEYDYANDFINRRVYNLEIRIYN
jgi:hypothetical protein